MDARAAKQDFEIAGEPAGAEPDDRFLGVVPGLVWAFRVHPDGAADPLDTDGPIEATHDGWLWLHFNLADIRAVRWLESCPLVPDEGRALLLSDEGYQRLQASGAGMHGVLADFVRHLDRPSEEVAHLHFTMTERVLISGRRHPLQAVEATRRALQAGRRLSSVAALIESIIDHVADAIDDMTEKLGEELDHIEELVLSVYSGNERQKLGRLRRTTVRLHRQLGGLRTLLLRLERQEHANLSPACRLATGALAQRLDGLDHEVVAMRDRARMLQEEVAAKTAEQTNERLQWLAIMTALFLPPTLVTGFWGMNLKGMPLAESEIGGLTATLLCVAASAVAYWLIRRKIRGSD
jgi:zinc transporter